MGVLNPLSNVNLDVTSIIDAPIDGAWDPGVYTLMEYIQLTNGTDMPVSYTGQTGSVYYTMETETWLRGVCVSLNIGDFITGINTYDWTSLDNVFANIKKINDNNNLTGIYKKKVMFRLVLKVTEIANASRLLPNYAQFRSSAGTYAGVGGISNGADCPNYNYLWGYKQGSLGKGYHYKLADFRNGLTGLDAAGNPIYTMRDMVYAAMQVLADRFANDVQWADTYAGMITTESASLNSIDGSIIPNSGTGRNNHFAGRLALLKKMKQIFTRHLLAEGCNFDAQWVNAMAGASATDGMLANKLACTTADWHIGGSLDSIHRYKENFASTPTAPGVLPIIAQIQPDAMESRTHNEAGYWGWSVSNPTVKGAFNSSGGNVHPAHNPPDGEWQMKYLTVYHRANYILHQYNKSNASGLPDSATEGHARFNWNDFKAYMSTGPYKDDPFGGCVAVRPIHVVN